MEDLYSPIFFWRKLIYVHKSSKPFTKNRRKQLNLRKWFLTSYHKSTCITSFFVTMELAATTLRVCQPRTTGNLEVYHMVAFCVYLEKHLSLGSRPIQLTLGVNMHHLMSKNQSANQNVLQQKWSSFKKDEPFMRRY